MARRKPGLNVHPPLAIEAAGDRGQRPHEPLGEVRRPAHRHARCRSRCRCGAAAVTIAASASRSATGTPQISAARSAVYGATRSRSRATPSGSAHASRNASSARPSSTWRTRNASSAGSVPGAAARWRSAWCAVSERRGSTTTSCPPRACRSRRWPSGFGIISPWPWETTVLMPMASSRSVVGRSGRELQLHAGDQLGHEELARAVDAQRAVHGRRAEGPEEALGHRVARRDRAGRRCRCSWRRPPGRARRRRR